MHKEIKAGMVQAKTSCTWNAVQAKESNTPTLHIPEYFLRYIKRQSKQKEKCFLLFLTLFHGKQGVTADSSQKKVQKRIINIEPQNPHCNNLS